MDPGWIRRFDALTVAKGFGLSALLAGTGVVTYMVLNSPTGPAAVQPGATVTPTVSSSAQAVGYRGLRGGSPPQTVPAPARPGMVPTLGVVPAAGTPSVALSQWRHQGRDPVGQTPTALDPPTTAPPLTTTPRPTTTPPPPTTPPPTTPPPTTPPPTTPPPRPRRPRPRRPRPRRPRRRQHHRPRPRRRPRRRQHHRRPGLRDCNFNGSVPPRCELLAARSFEVVGGGHPIGVGLSEACGAGGAPGARTQNRRIKSLSGPVPPGSWAFVPRSDRLRVLP